MKLTEKERLRNGGETIAAGKHFLLLHIAIYLGD